MPRRCIKEQKIKSNVKVKLTVMIICVGLMLFSIMQVYYLAKYTLGLEVSSREMAVYNWVNKLVSFEWHDDTGEYTK